MNTDEQLRQMQSAIEDGNVGRLGTLDGASLTAIDYRALLRTAAELGQDDCAQYLSEQLLQTELPHDQQGSFVRDTLYEAMMSAFDEREPETALALFDADLDYEPDYDIVKNLLKHNARNRARTMVQAGPNNFEADHLKYIVNRFEAPNITETLVKSLDGSDLSTSSGIATDLARNGSDRALEAYIDKVDVDRSLSDLLAAAVSSSDDRATVELLLDYDAITIDDVREESVEQAAQSGHSETLLTLLDAGYDRWNNAILSDMTEHSDDGDKKAVNDEVVRRLYEQVLHTETNEPFNRHLFTTEPRYDQNLRDQAIEQYRGAPLQVVSPEQFDPDDARRLIERRKISLPHRLVRQLISRADAPQARREALSDDVDELIVEEIVIDTLQNRNPERAVSWVEVANPDRRSTAASKLLKNGWSHGTDRRLAHYWDIYRRDDQADRRLPMDVKSMAAHAAAYYQTVGGLIELIDRTDLRYTDLPDRVLAHFAQSDPDFPEDIVGRRQPDVTELYDHAREQSEQEFEHVRSAFGSRPVLNALDSVTWRRETKQVLQSGAMRPEGDEAIPYLIKSMGKDDEIFAALLDTMDELPDEVLFEAFMEHERAIIDRVVEHAELSSDVLVRAINRIIARSDVPNTRLHRFEYLEDEHGVSVNWSYEPENGADAYNHDPLTYVVKYEAVNDTGDDDINSTLPKQALIERLLQFGADPTANNARPIEEAIEQNEWQSFNRLLDAVDDLGDYSGLIMAPARKGRTAFLEPLVDHGVDPNYNDGQVFMTITERALSSAVSIKKEFIETLISLGADPASDGARQALNEWIQGAGDGRAQPDSDACGIVRLLLRAQREHGELHPPDPSVFEGFPDAPVVDVVCEQLTKRQAQGLREQARTLNRS